MKMCKHNKSHQHIGACPWPLIFQSSLPSSAGRHAAYLPSNGNVEIPPILPVSARSTCQPFCLISVQRQKKKSRPTMTHINLNINNYQLTVASEIFRMSPKSQDAQHRSSHRKGNSKVQQPLFQGLVRRCGHSRKVVSYPRLLPIGMRT